MGQEVICENCGETLFNEIKLKPPEEVIQELLGKCPYCGKELIFDPEKVQIRAT